MKLPKLSREQRLELRLIRQALVKLGFSKSALQRKMGYYERLLREDSGASPVLGI